MNGEKTEKLKSAVTLFSWHREIEFTRFFFKKGNLVSVTDVQALMKCFNIEYDPFVWFLLIEHSWIILKVTLLHNGYIFTSVPLGHSVHLEECYNNISLGEKLLRTALGGLWRQNIPSSYACEIVEPETSY